MENINLVFLLIALSLFFVVFYGPWQTLCIDWARQRMFEARDEIFDLASQGHLDFSSREYRELRSSIERMIRFCHMTSWPRLLLWNYLPGSSDEKRKSIFELVNGIQSDFARERVKSAFSSVSRAILLCVTGRSILLCTYFLYVRFAHYVDGRISAWLFRTVERDSNIADQPSSVGFARAQ